jgi:hypothetical protein
MVGGTMSGMEPREWASVAESVSTNLAFWVPEIGPGLGAGLSALFGVVLGMTKPEDSGFTQIRNWIRAETEELKNFYTRVKVEDAFINAKAFLLWAASPPYDFETAEKAIDYLWTRSHPDSGSLQNDLAQISRDDLIAPTQWVARPDDFVLTFILMNLTAQIVADKTILLSAGQLASEKFESAAATGDLQDDETVSEYLPSYNAAIGQIARLVGTTALTGSSVDDRVQALVSRKVQDFAEQMIWLVNSGKEEPVGWPSLQRTYDTILSGLDDDSERLRTNLRFVVALSLERLKAVTPVFRDGADWRFKDTCRGTDYHVEIAPGAIADEHEGAIAQWQQCARSVVEELMRRPAKYASDSDMPVNEYRIENYVNGPVQSYWAAMAELVQAGGNEPVNWPSLRPTYDKYMKEADGASRDFGPEVRSRLSTKLDRLNALTPLYRDGTDWVFKDTYSGRDYSVLTREYRSRPKFDQWVQYLNGVLADLKDRQRDGGLGLIADFVRTYAGRMSQWVWSYVVGPEWRGSQRLTSDPSAHFMPESDYESTLEPLRSLALQDFTTSEGKDNKVKSGDMSAYADKYGWCQAVERLILLRQLNRLKAITLVYRATWGSENSVRKVRCGWGYQDSQRNPNEYLRPDDGYPGGWDEFLYDVRQHWESNLRAALKELMDPPKPDEDPPYAGDVRILQGWSEGAQGLLKVRLPEAPVNGCLIPSRTGWQLDPPPPDSSGWSTAIQVRYAFSYQNVNGIGERSAWTPYYKVVRSKKDGKPVRGWKPTLHHVPVPPANPDFPPVTSVIVWRQFTFPSTESDRENVGWPRMIESELDPGTTTYTDTKEAPAPKSAERLKSAEPIAKRGQPG